MQQMSAFDAANFKCLHFSRFTASDIYRYTASFAMKLQVLILLLAFCGLTAQAQPVNWSKVESALKEEEAAFARQAKPAKVLLLGTFHFNYPNQDDHKTDKSKQVDILSEARQKEVQQVVEL